MSSSTSTGVEVAAAPGWPARAAAYYREVVAEMRKVTWPDQAQLRQATVQIIIFVLLLGAVIAVLDLGLQFFLVRLPAMLLGR